MEKCILENLHIVDNAALPVKGEAFNACWVDKGRGRETTTQPNLNTGMEGEEGRQSYSRQSNIQAWGGW